MSFAEKSSWISLFVVAGVFIFYLVSVFRIEGGIGANPRPVVGLLIGATVFLVVLEIGLHIVLGIAARGNTAEDERDRVIKLKSYRTAYIAMAVGVVYLVGTMAVRELAGAAGMPDNRTAGMLVVHILVCVFVIAEIAGFVTQLILYRSGG